MLGLPLLPVVREVLDPRALEQRVVAGGARGHQRHALGHVAALLEGREDERKRGSQRRALLGRHIWGCIHLMLSQKAVFAVMY